MHSSGVFHKLRIWIDANHDGISQPAELHTLWELGIRRIDLKYRQSDYVDKFGNQFRYRGRIWDAAGIGHEVCYDVFLKIASGNVGSAGVPPGDARAPSFPDPNKSGVTGALTGSVILASESPRMQVHNPLKAEGLTVLDAKSPRFAEEVARLLDASTSTKAANFLPQSLVIINDTERWIWGFTVIYVYPDWIAPSGKPHRHVISPSAGGPDPGRRFMLEPGGAFLITPVSSFLASRRANGQIRQRPVLDEGLDRIIRIVESQELMYRVEAFVDSVIYEDGTIVGSDTAGRKDLINARTTAEMDLSHSLDGMRGEELRKALKVEAGLDASGNYAEHRRKRARELLELLEASGEPIALQAVENFKTVERFHGSAFVTKER